jgi:zinc protease
MSAHARPLLAMVLAASTLSAAPLARAAAGRGPAGSLVIVEEAPALPLVTLVVAVRTGSAADPRGQEGLADFAAELARHGAGRRSRAALDETLDGLGATLDVDVDPDSVRFVGQVLERNLDAFLALLADILLRPDFAPAELTRTRRELLAALDEARNDDRALCERFFERRLYGDHPYGHPPDGTAKSLARIGREDIAAHFRRTIVGKNLVFAASGALTLDDLRRRLEVHFGRLSTAAPPPPTAIPLPVRADGWRLQIVDKPDRQQTQIMFGHPTLPATDPDRVPLTLALASFGGRGMKATLMDEVRTKRGLAYGAYMGLGGHRGPSAVRGWVYTGTNRTVTTLKLVLRLYKKLRKDGLSPERLQFFQRFVAGSYAADMDDPSRRLAARVTAEIQGLPADEVDTFADKIRAVTPAQAAAAIERHLDPEHLAITLVGTAEVLVPLLLKSKVDEAAMDVVPFDSY